MKGWILAAFLAIAPGGTVPPGAEPPPSPAAIPEPLAREMAFDIPVRQLSAPVFSLRDVDGQAIDLTQLRGRVVMLYFWTTW